MLQRGSGSSRGRSTRGASVSEGHGGSLWGSPRSQLERARSPEEAAQAANKAALLELVIIPAELAAGVSDGARVTAQLQELRDLTRDAHAEHQARCMRIRDQVRRIQTKCK